MEDHELTFCGFPRTPHVLHVPELRGKEGEHFLSDEGRKCLLSARLHVEEKVDGSNTGISFDADGVMHFQGREKYLSERKATHEQYHRMFNWWWERRDAAWELLGPTRIIYGEWLYAKHTLKYEALPDYFLGFDVFEREHPQSPDGHFWSHDRRDELFAQLGIHRVPSVADTEFPDLDRLLALAAGPSDLGCPEKEGLYVRLEEDGRLTMRAKHVRPEFREKHRRTHWKSRYVPETNLLLEV